MQKYKVMFATQDIDGDEKDYELEVSASSVSEAEDAAMDEIIPFMRGTLDIFAKVYSVELVGTKIFEE